MAGPESEGITVLAEKPSVARDIARVLGAAKQGDGYLHGNGYVATWAIGHPAALAQPHEIHPEWRHWRRNLLPMLPRQWPLVIYEKTKKQFDVVQRIRNSPRIAQIVCATDAGREGELIFRYIYEAAGCSKPSRRLWISSLTPEAIRQGCPCAPCRAHQHHSIGRGVGACCELRYTRLRKRGTIKAPFKGPARTWPKFRCAWFSPHN